MVLQTFDEITILWVETDIESIQETEEGSSSNLPTRPLYLVLDDLRLLLSRLAHDRTWDVSSHLSTYLEIRDQLIKPLYQNISLRNQFLGIKLQIITKGKDVEIGRKQGIQRDDSSSSTTTTSSSSS
jgi:hypothetical protein